MLQNKYQSYKIYHEDNSSNFHIIKDIYIILLNKIKSENFSIYYVLPGGLEYKNTYITWKYGLISSFCDCYSMLDDKLSKTNLIRNVIKGIKQLPTYYWYYILLEDIHIASRGGDGIKVICFDNIDDIIVDNACDSNNIISYLLELIKEL